MIRRLASLAGLVLLVACGSRDHVNPYDPATPPALQARATLAGKISLEAAGSTAPSLAGVHVSVSGQSFAADTDATGHYAIAGVPPGTWTVQAVRAGWDDAVLAGIAISLDDGGHLVSLPDLALPLARGAVAGAVMLDDTLGGASGPLAGASVSLSGVPGSVTTDSAGGFLISGVPAGTYSLGVSKPGFLDASVASFAVAAHQVNDAPNIPVQWDPGGVSGSLLVQGAPDSSGVTVTISGATLIGSPFRATTGSAFDGSWGLVGLVPTGTYNVTFQLSNYAEVSTSATVAAHTTTVVPAIALVRDTGSVTGTALLAGSSSSAGIAVTLTPLAGGTPAAALTDTSGIWRLDGVPVGAYSIAYQKTPGYGPQSGLVTVVSHTTVTASQVTLAAIPGTLRGHCFLEGHAAGNHDGTTVRLVGGTLSTVTLADGSWVLSGVGTGTQVVAFERAGFDSQQAQAVTAPGGDLTLFDVTLATSRGSIGGQFTLSGAASAAGVVVSASGPSVASTVTDASGAFSLPGLPVGTYAVSGRRDPDWQPLTVTGVVVTAGVTSTVPGSPISLSPVRTASISGTALLGLQASSSGIGVTVTGTDFRGVALAPALTTATNAAGAWSFSGLAAGSYQVSFSRAGFDAPVPAGVSVVAGQAASLGTVTLSVSTGDIAGTVVFSAGSIPGFAVGADASGAVVTLAGTDVPVPAAVTDSAGSYRFSGVPVSLSGASFTVTARKANFVSASTTVLAIAHTTTVVGGALTLPVNAGSLTGTTLLWDNVNGSGTANPTSAGVVLTVSGAAFNGSSYLVTPSPVSAASGAWTVAALPPGSYDVVASGASRTCGAIPSAVVAEGAAVSLVPAVRCLDAVAPGPLALGAPTPPAGAQAGYTNLASVTVPIVTPASDGTLPTSNLRGYQIALGASPDWSTAVIVPGQPLSLTFSGLAANATSTLWARAVDWAGNAGLPARIDVVHDGIAPRAPSISTPRLVVDATTTAVTLSGSESDLNFSGYQECGVAIAATATCPATPPAGCTFAATDASYAPSLAANQRNCLYARALDKAGNTSSIAGIGVVSDLTAPSPPQFSPSYDTARLSVRAPWVDFFLTGAATDAPGAGGPWQGVAWIEVDAGPGFAALCPQAACHAGNAYAPCGCGCTDARLLCNGSTFVGVRAPLTEGTSNPVSFRAVDFAGNTGTGVTQIVQADALRDLVAVTSDYETNPNVRGRLLAYGARPIGGFTTGMVIDLGPNRRIDGTEVRCPVSTSISESGNGHGISPGSPTLVATAEYGTGLRVARPAASGLWCNANGTFAGSSAILQVPPLNYYTDGVSAAGERVAWWERLNAGTANLFVREPGPDGLVGTADDVTASFVYNYVAKLTLGDRALLVQQASCGASCYNWVWRIISPGAGGSYAAGATAVDLPATASAASMSLDGLKVAYLDSGTTLVVRRPGSNGIFDASDDVYASRPVPWSMAGVSETAVDGSHVVALMNSSPINYLVHWWAGPDGTFGTADDVLEQVRPTGTSRMQPTLHDGYLAFSEGSDILGLDLSTLRWELAPSSALAGYDLSMDGSGTLFYEAAGAPLVARTSAGVETVATGFYPSTNLSIDQNQLLSWNSSTITVRQPDATGTWFTASAPTPATVYSTTASITFVTLGGGKALIVDFPGGNTHYRILEPNGHPLSAFPTYGTAIDVTPGGQGWATSGAIGPRQAFYNCDGITLNLCVSGAGADGFFGTADDPAVFRLVHPVGSPRAGSNVHDARGILLSGKRMLLTEFSPPAIYLFDAGADGLFGTADDRGRKLADVYVGTSELALAGEFAAFVDAGPPGGSQIHFVHGFDGPVTTLTGYYSPKRALALDATGRIFWIDGAFAPEGIFAHLP